MDEAGALSRAVHLARRGRFQVEPNPMVGALVLSDGAAAGEGWHRAFGGPHAEIEALASAGGRARGATLVVTLEPCSTRGKTPACTDALIAAGIRRLVVGAVDPNPAHAGRGLDALAAAGIDVVLADDAACARLIVPFTAALARRRPWVLGKWAMSRDGAVAPPGGGPAAISGPTARALVQRWRAHVDAILVGVGTVAADDPRLTVRNGPASVRPPRRVVLDPALRTPLHARIVRTAGEAPTWIYAAEEADQQPQAALESAGVTVWRVPGERFLDEVLRSLHGDGVRRLMVEGGPTTHGALLGAGLVDQLAVFLCPMELGAGSVAALAGMDLAGADSGRVARALELIDPQVERAGTDLLLRGDRAARDLP